MDSKETLKWLMDISLILEDNPKEAKNMIDFVIKLLKRQNALDLKDLVESVSLLQASNFESAILSKKRDQVVLMLNKRIQIRNDKVFKEEATLTP